MKCNNIPKPNTITQLLVALMFVSVFGADSAFGQTVHNDNASHLPKAENKVADTESVRHLLHQAQGLSPLASLAPKWATKEQNTACSLPKKAT